MNGFVDNEGRALIEVMIGTPDSTPLDRAMVWIDTAFNGSLVLPESLIDNLCLPQQSSAEAILADGNKVELATFGCSLVWFGKKFVTQVTTNKGSYGLIGTMLLKDRKLTIDYAKKSVTIE